jgi:1,2-diacylglycerol 3-beta-glucosyltransferase
MIELFDLALALPSAFVFLVGLYLMVLTVAALVGRPVIPPNGRGERRFAILIPAHDEALVIGRLLQNLRILDYPSAHFDVHVVADNCEDGTAEEARSCGATVHERADRLNQGKPHAIAWLLERLQNAPYNAFVIIDADCVVSPNLLARMDARLEAGADVVQAHYSVLNICESPLSGLRFAALAGYNYLRPLGRSALGWSAGLKGTGMCFSASTLATCGWNLNTLAEDAEFHLTLVRKGIRVDFAPEALVLSDMPITFAQAMIQNARWERGRLEVLRQQVPALMVEALRRRRVVCLDAAIEQLIPPLSVPFAIAAVCIPMAFAADAPVQAALAAGGLLGQVIYLLSAMVLVRAPWRTYLSLLHAPRYILWKVRIYIESLARRDAPRWVRTPRIPRNGL